MTCQSMNNQDKFLTLGLSMSSVKQNKITQECGLELHMVNNFIRI